MSYWRLATAGLRHQWIRSFLTTLGIVIAVAAVFTLFSTINGLKLTVMTELSKVGANKIIIAPGTTGMMNLGGVYFTESDVKTVQRVPGVKDVLPIAIASGSAECCGKGAGILLEGADPGEFSKIYESMGAYVEDGRPLRSGDKYTALVGNSIAHDAFGKDLHAGTTILINGKRFKIVGILKKTGGPMDSAVYVPISAFEELTGKSDKYCRIVATTSTGADITRIAERIKRALKLHRGQEDFHILTPERMANMANQIISIIEALLVSIAAIALIVGAVGIMNTMYMSVTERTREIGVMKAVGATRGQIMTVFLVEAGLLGLIGGVVGTLLGLGITSVAEKVLQAMVLDTYRASYNPFVAISLIAFSAVMGIISGYLPAKEGADKDPIEAIRQ